MIMKVKAIGLIVCVRSRICIYKKLSKKSDTLAF